MYCMILSTQTVESPLKDSYILIGYSLRSTWSNIQWLPATLIGKNRSLYMNIFFMPCLLCANVLFCILIDIDTFFNQLPCQHSMEGQLILRSIVMQQAVICRNDFIIHPLPIFWLSSALCCIIHALVEMIALHSNDFSKPSSSVTIFGGGNCGSWHLWDLLFQVIVTPPFHSCFFPHYFLSILFRLCLYPSPVSMTLLISKMVLQTSSPKGILDLVVGSSHPYF